MSPSILVVEDDLDFRELLVEHLEASGRSVRCAGNGAEALAALSRKDRDIGLVLLDLRMPVMDGFEMCRRMRADRALDGIPVIVMTAEHDVRDVADCHGVVAVLHKPIEIARLEDLVDLHLDGIAFQHLRMHDQGHA